jgi:3-hydroxybutyryl-CoA dehydratase
LIGEIGPIHWAAAQQVADPWEAKNNRSENMNELMGYDIEDLEVGMTARFSKTITEADIVMFAGVSGDNNAIHINEEFALGTVFKGRIAHGMLSASVISAAIANKLPGPGTIYMSQNLRFKAPVRAGDTVHAQVIVKEIFVDKQRVLLTTECFVKEETVVEGEALVQTTSRKSRTIE